MKTKVLTSFLLCACASIAMGQEYKDFDLGNYKLPDITRNQLDFTLHSSGKYSDMNEGDSKSTSVTGNFGTAFDRYKITRSFMGHHRASIEVEGDYDKSENNKSNYYNVTLAYDNSSRFYNDRLLFFETGVAASINQFGKKTDFKMANDLTQTHGTEVNLAIPLRVGTGRIERVEDARQAIYILENLSKQKVLNRRLTTDEIMELSRLISVVKNKRHFDTRLRMIDEIGAVDSFFVANDLLASNGSAYFTTLYDYWMYGDRFRRGAGLEFSGGLTPGFNYNRNTYWDDKKDVIPSLRADLSLAYEKPANLYIQHSADAGVFGFYQRGDDLNNLKYNDYNAGIEGGYTLGYYPNSRTNINFGIREHFGWQKFDYSDAPLSDNWMYTVTHLNLNMYYYFSPQLRLALNGSVGYRYMDRDDFYTRWQCNFEASIVYSLF